MKTLHLLAVGALVTSALLAGCDRRTDTVPPASTTTPSPPAMPASPASG